MGFGVPLVTLRPGHALRLQPVPRRPLIPQGHLPHLFFFFSRRRRSFSVWCFLVSCLVGVGGLGGCFCPWSWSLSGGCIVSVSCFGLEALSSFFWVGGVPLAAFSLPLVSWFWVAGLGISAFFASCVSLLQLGKPGPRTRKPPGPCSPLPWRVPPHPSPAGSRRWDALR